jgi:peptidoglycan hydrolase-like protein with peptidoglycan-binding domain
LKKEISRVQALLAAKNQTTISCTQLTKDLYYGIKNDPEVKCLQEFLKIQGLFNGPITGSFYTLTKTTVIAFQEKYSSEILTPLGLTHGTGIVAGNTRAKINKLLLMGN